MRQGIIIRVCTACGYSAFPGRLLCPDCGGRRWRNAPALTGVVEEMTVVRRPGDLRHLATVRVSPSTAVVALLSEPVSAGCEVELHEHGSGRVLARTGRRLSR